MGCVDYCKHWSCQDEQRNTPKVVQIPFTCETKSRVHVIPKYCQCSPINPKSSSCCVWCPLLHWNVSFISFSFSFFLKLKWQKTMSVDGFSNSKLKLLHLKKNKDRVWMYLHTYIPTQSSRNSTPNPMKSDATREISSSL